MTGSIVLRGGRVIDPSQGLDGRADVVLRDGKVLGLDVPPPPGADLVDVSGLIVTPGLIDIHVHAYGNLGFAYPDRIGIDQGVTTFVEAGGPGVSTFDEFLALMPGRTVTDLYAGLYIRPLGIIGVGHVEGDVRSLATVPIEEWLDVVTAHRDVIRYLKVGAFGDYGTGPLKMAKGLAEILELPTYTHIGDFQVNPSRLTTRDAFRIAEVGDIVTHLYHGNPGGILDEEDKVFSEVWEARRRGALFDIGFGANNFSFVVAEKAAAQDMIPDLISSDLQQFNVLGPVYSLAHVASVFLQLGLSLAEVIERVTIAPARALGLDDRAGSLRPGMPADVTVLRLEDGDFEFADCYDNTRKGKQRLVPVMAFKRGVRHDSDPLSCQDERNWHTQIAENHVPQAAARLSDEERRFLSALVRDLEHVAWDGDVIDLHRAAEVQRRFHAASTAAGLPLKAALTAVYDSFLDDPFTYQIGLFLTRMNRDFVLNRLNEVGAETAVPAH